MGESPTRKIEKYFIKSEYDIERKNKVNKTKMMTTQIQIPNTVMKTLTGMVQSSMEEGVKLLSEKYGFDRAEAVEYLKVAEIEVVKAKKAKAPKKEKVVVPKKPAFLLPWGGSVVTGWCGALRYNKGLFTQCTQKCKGGSQFCGTCLKYVSVDGIPQYGLASERSKEGWTAPNGKSPVNYANVMAKLKNGDEAVTQEMAVAEAAKFDWTIPEEQFVKSKTRKGRPAKAKAEKTEKKTRGRPKKEKPMTQGGAGDDLIAQLVAQANIQNGQIDAPVEEEKNSPSTEEDETETTDQSEPTTPNQPTEAVKPDAPKKAKKPRKPKMTEEEKEAAKLAKQQEREAKKAAAKAEKEAAKALAKAEKEAEKAKLKLEKEAAKALAKAEKEAKKPAKKTKKAAAKVETPVESPKTQTDEKESTPEQLAEDLAEMELKPETPTQLEEDDESEEEEEEVKVENKTGADGKSYMVDADGNVYDEEGYEIGTWDEETMAVVA